MTLIRVGDDRLGDTETVTTPDKLDLAYSSRARSLVDAVYDWSRFSSLPCAFSWIRRDLADSKISTADLVDATLKYANQATIRRIGFLLTGLSKREEGLARLIPTKLVLRLERTLRRSSATIPWIPTMPKRGQVDKNKVNKQWGIVVNGTIPAPT